MTMAVRSGFRQFFKTKNMASYGTSSWFIGTSIARCWLVVWNIFSIQFGIIIPTDYIIFFRGVGIPPTRLFLWSLSIAKCDITRGPLLPAALAAEELGAGDGWLGMTVARNLVAISGADAPSTEIGR